MAAASSLLMGGLSIANTISQSAAYDRQNSFNSAMADINSRRAAIAEADALKRGEKETLQHKQQVNKMVGAQKAAMAAQGIRFDSGSAADVLEETQVLGYEDAQKIKTNAFREALGFRTQAQEYQMNKEMASREAQYNKSATLLSGGMQAAGFFSKFAQDKNYGSK